MKKKSHQRELPGTGNYLGLFTKQIWSIGKVSDPEKMEAALKEWFQLNYFNPESLISECEYFFTELLEEHGIEIKSPYPYGEIEAAIKEQSKPNLFDPELLFQAAKILDKCESLRKAIEAVAVGEIVRESMLLQHHLMAYNLVQWEPSARVGEAQIRAGYEGAKYSKDEKDGWIVRYKELSAEGLSDRSAAAIIEIETGHKLSSIRNHIRNYKNKLAKRLK